MTTKQKEAVEKVLTLLKESKIDTDTCMAIIEAIIDKEVDVRYVPQGTYPFDVTYTTRTE